jgi:hypothetical protein
VEYFKKFEDRKIVLDLPSAILGLPPPQDSNGLWYCNREHFYMNYQTQHKQIIVGGINGYVSTARLGLDRWISKLPEGQAIGAIKAMGVQYIVFHKRLIMISSEDILAGLQSSQRLKQVANTDDLSIFEIE